MTRIIHIRLRQYEKYDILRMGEVRYEEFHLLLDSFPKHVSSQEPSSVATILPDESVVVNELKGVHNEYFCTANSVDPLGAK